MNRQRGNIALYLLFSLAVSTGAGYGVYVLLRDRPRAAAADDVETAAVPARPIAPAPQPQQPAPDPEPLADTPDAVDVAERDAVEPQDIADPPNDTVLLGRPGVAGELAPAKVERTVRSYLVRYERCMRRAKERGASRRGDLRLVLVVGADGKVEHASANTSVDGELAACIVDVVKKLKFDKSTDGAMVKVVYPMRLVPAASSDDDASGASGVTGASDPWSD